MRFPTPVGRGGKNVAETLRGSFLFVSPASPVPGTQGDLRVVTCPRVVFHSRTFSRVGISLSFVLLLLLSTVLWAQDVSLTTNGPVSMVPAPPIYNGQYVLLQSDFGFFWLDTEALLPGHVQALSKCGPWPPADSNLYVVGDCNAISNISSSGNLVLARNLSGNCGGIKRGCNGPRDDGHTYILFTLGSWTYLNGEQHDIPDSTQTTDLQGRTWAIHPDPLFTDGRHFIFHTDGNPTAPPAARASATNQSAAGRADKTNYFGDAWSLQDISVSVATITQVQWDFRYDGTFVPDRTAGKGDTINPAFFPCDSSGNIGTGVGCFGSVVAGSYSFALKATNQYGTTQYTSPAMSVAIPQIRIVGFSGGALNVLTGGNADASATDGNPAAFNWIFNPGAVARGPAAVVAVPPGATSFSLVVPYAGYSASVSGSVSQVDLVPAFTVSPSPVIVGATLTLTNQMQKGPAATLNSVDYAIDGGSFSPLVTCPASFCNVLGTAAITAPPAPAGNHTVGVRYNFNGSGGAQSLTTSDPFATIVFTPNPIPIITLDSSGATLACAGFGTCNLQTGTTYYLFDFETLPGGVTHPGTQWTYNASPIGTSPGAGPVAWTPASPCSSGCTLQVTVGGVSSSMPITISGSGPPTGLSFYTVTPCRLFDTRNPAGPLAGPALVAGANRTLTAAGQCGIPATARALSLNVTVTQPGAAGDLRFFPGGSAVPLVSSINYRAGQSRANSAVAVLGAAGDLTVLCDQGAGTVQLILDVNGYFQ